VDTRSADKAPCSGELLGRDARVKRLRGRGSAGRASPCQGEGRGFESRRPLQRSCRSRWCGELKIDLRGGSVVRIYHACTTFFLSFLADGPLTHSFCR